MSPPPPSYTGDILNFLVSYIYNKLSSRQVQTQQASPEYGNFVQNHRLWSLSRMDLGVGSFFIVFFIIDDNW